MSYDILIGNELVDEAKRKKSETLLFEVDFEKVADLVDWKYIDHVLEKMVFV